MFPEKSGTPESSILIGFSIINHPFWGIFGNTHISHRITSFHHLKKNGTENPFLLPPAAWILVGISLQPTLRNSAKIGVIFLGRNSPETQIHVYGGEMIESGAIQNPGWSEMRL